MKDVNYMTETDKNVFSIQVVRGAWVEYPLNMVDAFVDRKSITYQHAANFLREFYQRNMEVTS